MASIPRVPAIVLLGISFFVAAPSARADDGPAAHVAISVRLAKDYGERRPRVPPTTYDTNRPKDRATIADILAHGDACVNRVVAAHSLLESPRSYAGRMCAPGHPVVFTLALEATERASEKITPTVPEFGGRSVTGSFGCRVGAEIVDAATAMHGVSLTVACKETRTPEEMARWIADAMRRAWQAHTALQESFGRRSAPQAKDVAGNPAKNLPLAPSVPVPRAPTRSGSANSGEDAI